MGSLQLTVALMRLNTKHNMKKEKGLTLKDAQAQVKKANEAFTLNKSKHTDEYHLNLGEGRGIYFTPDLKDAVDTAILIAKGNNDQTSSQP